MGEIFNLDDMIKKEMKGFKKDENSSAKPSEYLREYADTLQELAEIIRSYLDIADEYLQDMIGQTKLDYRDFCIEEDDIEVFLESITDSNLAYLHHHCLRNRRIPVFYQKSRICDFSVNIFFIYLS